MTLEIGARQYIPLGKYVPGSGSGSGGLPPVDNQTIQYVDGVLHVNFDEIGGEVNVLANRVSTVETELGTLAEKVEELEVGKVPNMLILGNPTINNGQVSNFTSTNYLQFPFEFEPLGHMWKLKGSFRTNANMTIQQNIIDSSAAIALAVRNNYLVMALSTNGTTFDLGEETSMSELQPNTNYFFEIEYNTEQYILSLSTDEQTYLPEIVYYNGTPIATKKIMTISSPNHPYGDIINLNDWELTIEDELVWQGMKTVDLDSKMDSDAANITESGITKLKEVLGLSNIETILDEILGNQEAISTLVYDINGEVIE